MHIVHKQYMLSSTLTRLFGTSERCISAELPIEETNPRLNKSRLREHHRNVLHNKRPYEFSHSWYHETEKYQRKILGRYGLNTGIPPNICFPTRFTKSGIPEENTFLEMVEISKRDERAKADAKRLRDEQVLKNMENLARWKMDLKVKTEKKEADALAAKIRKEKLIDEVRKHLGFKVDPRDERFKDMLAQKEKEEKKKIKEAKRKAKDEILMKNLIEKSKSLI